MRMSLKDWKVILMSEVDWEEELKKAYDEDSSGAKEVNPNSMRASSTGFCPRQMFIGKMGLNTFNDYVKGMLVKGSAIHSLNEQKLSKRLDDCSFEENVMFEEGGITFTGSYDAFDGERVVDWKTQNGGLENVAQEPRDKDVDQLHVYMKGAGVEKAVLVYIDAREFLNYRNIVTVKHEVEFDESRWADICTRVKAVLDEVQKFDLGKKDDSVFTLDEEQIPFEKCGCYFCKQESKDLSKSVKIDA